MAAYMNVMGMEVRSDLKKVWLKYLQSNGLERAYIAAKAAQWQGALTVCADPTSIESRLFPGLGKAYNDEVERISDVIVGKLAQKKNMTTQAVYDALGHDAKAAKQLRAQMRASPEWSKFFKIYQKTVMTVLDDIAKKKGVFCRSPEFKAWVKARIKVDQIALALQLESYKKDDLESLAESYVTDDRASMTRISKSLSKSGYDLKTDRMIKLLHAKFGKLKLY